MSNEYEESRRPSNFVIPCLISSHPLFCIIVNDVILFAKSKESVRGCICFQKETDSKNFSLIDMPF